VKSVTGDLTIMGTTKPVTLDATAFTCTIHPQNKKKLCGGDFSATIKRSEFGMTRSIPVHSDEIVLRIGVEALKD
jgi:polyisoprenoid-binding protein YceI